jgi:hypothetical protein
VLVIKKTNNSGIKTITMLYILKKSSKISACLMLLFLICFYNNTYSKCCKKKHKKKKVKVSEIDTSNSYSPFPIYHDLGPTKEDSTRLSIASGKEDMRSYMFLKYNKEYDFHYIDSLYNTGYRIDTLEYYQLHLKRSKENIEKRKQKK